MLRILLVCLVAALFATTAQAQPRAAPWPVWDRHDPASTVAVDHSAWAAFLLRHRVAAPDGVARIAYGRVPAADRAALGAYLERLQAVPVSGLARAEQFAFWANFYNAATVLVVLDHHPVASIRDIRTSPGLFAAGPWGRKAYRVEGVALSLDDIEHRILRPGWRDPRVHYALNCASVGCPSLPAAPFAAAGLDAALDAAARDFVGHPRGVRFDGAALVVSSVYRWFREDFGGDDAGILAHLRRHAPPALRVRLDGAARIERDQYDWSLNDLR